MTTTDELSRLEQDVLAEISGTGDLAAIEAVRVSALGKKGRVSGLMSALGKMPADERKAF
ncbi:MAG: phenylalanine--tRNA ligase subunit alpha, partial [Pseudomonadota bacterium]